MPVATCRVGAQATRPHREACSTPRPAMPAGYDTRFEQVACAPATAHELSLLKNQQQFICVLPYLFVISRLRVTSRLRTTGPLVTPRLLPV